MRRMLDPTKVGGIPSTIEFDKDGNRKVKKNLGVDGKLTLKSLVSATNPDGDITKELGGGGGGFNKYKIQSIEINVSGVSSEHTYTIGEKVGSYSGNITPPKDFNDGVCVLLGTSCSSSSSIMTPINKLGTISGDSIYYITGAKISKLDGQYFIEIRSCTINSGTATMGSSITSFASVIYAWIYK